MVSWTPFPIDGTSDFEGYKKPTPWPNTKLAQVRGAYYYAGSKIKEDWTDVVIFAHVAAPVPQWLIPLSLLKGFFAKLIVGIFEGITKNILPRWSEIGLTDRIDNNPDFYAQCSGFADD